MSVAASGGRTNFVSCGAHVSLAEQVQRQDRLAAWRLPVRLNPRRLDSGRDSPATAVDHAPRIVGWGFAALAVVAALTFFGLAFLFALTVPYHDWDAFAFGEWSRQIANGSSLDPTSLSAPTASRPVFFILQGGLWSVTGISFVAGRLLSLGFAIVAVVATAAMVGRKDARVFGLIAFLSISVFAQQAIAGLTDVPAAAGVAAVAAAALASPFRVQRPLVLTLAALAVLTKPSSVLPALAGLALALLIAEKPWSRSRVAASTSIWLYAGMLIGIAYDWLMAIRQHVGLVAFLRAGTTGYWAQLADSLRTDTLLRLDFLGPDLRLPLAFALVYAAGRALNVAHRPAAWLGLLLGGSYAIAGPFAAGVTNGPFSTSDTAFTVVGFALILGAVPFAPPLLQPDRLRTTQLLLIAVPPTVVWARFGVYADRLEAPAWPALAALIGVCLWSAVRVIHRAAGVASLAPIAILAVALWGSLVSIDGFHGPMWNEYRSLGLAGIWDTARTTNIVLPAVSEAVVSLQAEIGSDGRLVASDPRFLFWFPNTTIDYPTSCARLRGVDGFVLSTSDESQLAMRQAGGSPDPEHWANCQNPSLHELTDGSNGLASFVVIH